jgi:uncharacterized OB-fold protein
VQEITPRIGQDGVIYDLKELGDQDYDQGAISELLTSLATKGFLAIKEHDRTLFCPGCGAAHVYSKYACPSCQSIQTRKIELLEHPFCGYMGSKENFEAEGGSLTCPNCKTVLEAAAGSPADRSRESYKLVGSRFECEKCDHRFDRPNVLNHCQKCDASFNYKAATYKAVHSYELTDQVKQVLGWAINKALDPIQSILAARGYRVLRNTHVTGASGAEHTFSIAAKKDSTHIIMDVSARGDQEDMVSLLGKKMDVNPTMTFLIDMSANEELLSLGEVYGITVLNAKGADLEKALLAHLARDHQHDMIDRVMNDLQEMAGPSDLKPLEADLNHLILDALSAVSLPDNVKPVTDYGSIPEVKLDASHVKRVFHSVLHNAVQAMPEGGRLEISTRRRDALIEVVVKDTGVGMAPDNLERVFSPFFTTKAGGTGLSLANAKRVIEGHGGTITIDSEEGKGTTVTIRVPIAPESRPSASLYA